MAGILAHTIFKSEPFSAAAPFLNTHFAKTPQPRKASERHQRVCGGGAQNPEAPQRVQKILRKPATLDPPNNATSGPEGPPGPRARKAGAERQAAAPSMPFGFALWGAKSKTKNNQDTIYSNVQTCCFPEEVGYLENIISKRPVTPSPNPNAKYITSLVL